MQHVNLTNIKIKSYSQKQNSILDLCIHTCSTMVLFISGIGYLWARWDIGHITNHFWETGSEVFVGMLAEKCTGWSQSNLCAGTFLDSAAAEALATLWNCQIFPCKLQAVLTPWYLLRILSTNQKPGFRALNQWDPKAISAQAPSCCACLLYTSDAADE